MSQTCQIIMRLNQKEVQQQLLKFQQQQIYMQQMQDELVDISTSLVGLQAGLFFILLLCCLYKIKVAFFMKNNFILSFFLITLFYIVCELVIQIYQLVSIIIHQDPASNCSTVLALNIFCMIADIHLMLMLTLYWKEIQGSFIDSVGFPHLQSDRTIPSRMIVPTIWFFLYCGYFIYLLIGDQLSFKVDLSQGNKIALYIVVQAVCAFMLIVCGIWQSHHWCKMEDTIQTFQRIIPLTMNKTRFKAIFWITTVFNSLRTLFVTFLIVESYYQNYQNLIIGLICFTLTAILPISFYIFGFKIEESDGRSQKLIHQKSSSGRKTSSAHETELSRTSNSHRDSKNSQKKSTQSAK